MIDLNLMAIFARVVEAESFAEAARRMNTSRSAVSKAVAKLEKTLGARLVNRTTRHLSLTEIGSLIADHCCRMLEEADQGERLVASLTSEPRGVLRVSASVAFGTLHIAPALAEFLPLYPDLKIDLTITDRWVDLAEERYDLSIRVMDDPPGNWVARKLAPVRRRVCATPAYFDRFGIPQVPSDLGKHVCLDYALSGEAGRWRFVDNGVEQSVTITGPLRVDDDEALSQAVLGGLGVALLPTFIVGEDLQTGRLRAVLSDYTRIDRHVYALYLPTRHLPNKVRVFIDFLVERFGPEPYWDRPTGSANARGDEREDGQTVDATSRPDASSRRLKSRQ